MDKIKNITLSDRRKIARTDIEKDFESVLKMYRGVNLAPYLYGTCKKYGVKGAELWEWILDNVPDYYLKSAEIELLNNNTILKGIASIIGKRATLIELGPGSTVIEKTCPLMKKTKDLQGYVGIDLTQQYAINSTLGISKLLPNISRTSITCNFLDKRLKNHICDLDKPVFFSVGNTLCNIAEYQLSGQPVKTIEEMKWFRELANGNGYFVITQDTNQDEETLLRAYLNEGFERADLNIFNRIKKDVGVDIDKDKYKLEVIIKRNEHNQCCLVRKLVAKEEQEIIFNDKPYFIAKGSSLEVNRSYKFSADYFKTMAEEAGWNQQAVFFDSTNRMALHVFKCEK